MKPRKKRALKPGPALHKAIRLSILFIVLILPEHAISQETMICLPKAIKIAIQNNASIREAEFSRQSAVEKIKTKKANMFTTASANFAYTKLKHDPVLKIAMPGPSSAVAGPTEIQMAHSSLFYWGVSLVQPLFTGFALSTEHEMAKIDLEIKEQEKHRAILDLVQKVKEGYFTILFSKKIFLIAEDAIKSLESHEKDAEKFFNHGMIKYNDLLRARVALSNVRQDREKARAGVEMAVSQFNLLLDYEIDSKTQIEEISNITILDYDLLNLTRMAMEHRPVLKVLRLGLKNMDNLITLEKSAYYPGVSLVGVYGREGDDFKASNNEFTNDYNASISVQASWTFYDFGKRKSKISQVKKEYLAFLSKIKGMEDKIRLEVKGAYLNLGVARKNIATAKAALAQARENWRSSNLQYRHQVATSSEVLDARTFLTEADTNYYNALYGYMISLSKLKKAIGRPPF